MLAFPSRLLSSALLLAMTIPVYSASPQKQPRPQDPLELKIIGPRLIHEGQNVKFKIVLTNRSLTPIVLASRDSRLDFDLTWTISDSSGRELPRKQFKGLICPVGGKGWYKNQTRRMSNSDVTVLQPGEALEFHLEDVTGSYVFPSRGRYQAVFAYNYVPPKLEGRPGRHVDEFDQRYDLTDLSSSILEDLRHAVPISVSSSPVAMILQ
jgi:hypothetical protein